MKLAEIASVQTGYFGRASTSKEVLYLQVKDFDEDLQLDSELSPELAIHDINEKHFLLDGDVLFAAKGANNFAVVYKHKGIPAVASTSFFVIRLTDKAILADYLAWFINSKGAMDYLRAFSKGTSTLSISIKTLKELEIMIPSLKKQKNIINLVELRRKQKKINQEIDRLNELKIEQQLFNAIK